MKPSPDWMSAREAALQLDVKLETLYAYVSRGLVESVPGPRGRGRRYSRQTVERLKARHDARKGHGAVAAGALRWGEPTLETSISEIRADGPYYRGRALLTLCESAPSFEAVAELLWTGQLHASEPWPSARPKRALPPRPRTPAASAYLAAAVAAAALTDETRHGACDADEHARARGLIAWLASLAGGGVRAAKDRTSVAERLLLGFGVRASGANVRRVDRALILCAEHELNASTFAARVTASTGADLYACLGSALHALSGVRHGGMSARVEALVDEVGRGVTAPQVVRERLARGDALPGFGHPLYPTGDPRAAALLALADAAHRSGSRPLARAVPGRAEMSRLHALVVAMRKAHQPAPNLDAGLVAVCCALGLPRGAPGALFAVGRAAGWVAHALEQRSQGYLLRPRARYVPPLG